MVLLFLRLLFPPPIHRTQLLNDGFQGDKTYSEAVPWLEWLTFDFSDNVTDAYRYSQVSNKPRALPHMLRVRVKVTGLQLQNNYAYTPNKEC